MNTDRIKCIARKTLHALNVNGQWIAVSRGFMLASDVDRSKVTCPIPTHLYSVAIRYRRPDGKLAWFLGTQDAANKSEATRLARDAFTAEVPDTDPVSIFVDRA